MNHVAREFVVLRGIVIRIVVVLTAVFVGLLTLTHGESEMFGFRFPTLFPGTPSLSTELFLSAKAFLIPQGIPVVALGPVSPFVAPIVMAFLVALLVTFPYALFSLAGFISPALRSRERKTFRSFILPSLFLFYLGCAFSYFIIIPVTFSVLYSFAEPIGVAPFFALDEFVSSVFLLTSAVGFAFLLPVAMAMLSRSGMIPSSFWFRHFRAAVMIVVVFSAIVTPDGSGVTMAFLSVPLLGFYIIGALASRPRNPNRR